MVPKKVHLEALKDPPIVARHAVHNEAHVVHNEAHVVLHVDHNDAAELVDHEQRKILLLPREI